MRMMLDVAGFVGDLAEAPPRVVLNVGCGHRLPNKLPRHLTGPAWREVRLDVDPGVDPDIVCSITDMAPVASASVDAIWSSHSLEHLFRHEVPLALAEFRRVLRPGGMLSLTMPDLQRVAALVAEGGLEAEAYRAPSGPITAFDMLFGHADLVARGHVRMAHKSGFTAASLARGLDDAGFEAVEVRRGSAFDLWASARAPGGG